MASDFHPTQLEADVFLYLEENRDGSLNEIAVSLSCGFFRARRAGLVLLRAGLVSLHRTSEVQRYQLTDAGRDFAQRLRAPAQGASR